MTGGSRQGRDAASLDGGTLSVGQEPQAHITALPAAGCMSCPSLPYSLGPDKKKLGHSIVEFSFSVCKMLGLIPSTAHKIFKREMRL